MRVSNTPNDGMVQYITDAALDAKTKADLVECDCPDKAAKIVKEVVNRSIVAYQTIHEGEPLGTVRRNKETGDVAQRVDIDGIHKWQVMYARGGNGYDMRRSLPDWELVFSPPAEEE